MASSPFVCHARVREALASHRDFLLLKADDNSFLLQTSTLGDVTVTRSNYNTFSCTCVDYRLHTIPCKHMYWLAIKYLRVPVPDATKCIRWDDLLATAPTPSSELSAERKAEAVAVLVQHAKNVSLRFPNWNVPPKLDENSTCCICLDTLISWPPPRIHWCRFGCGIVVHETCGVQLREKECPQCRKPDFYINKRRYCARRNSDSD